MRNQSPPNLAIESTESWEHFPCGLVETTDGGEIIRSNSFFGNWTGLAPRAMVGRSIHDFVDAGPRDDAHPIRLPQMAFVKRAGLERLPVMVESALGQDGHRYFAITDATPQVAFAIGLQGEHALAQRTQERLELVIAASIAFAGAEAESELAKVLVDTATRAFSAEHAVVYLEGDPGRFQIAAGSSPFASPGATEVLTTVPSMLGEVVKVSGIEEARSLSALLGSSFEHDGVHAMISAPLKQSGEPLGALAVFFKHPRRFDEQASPLADALASQATRAIANLRLRAQLHHAAIHDGVTGLPNRRNLEEHLESLIPRDHESTAIVFIDMDGFKAINDQLGHHSGDDLLREVGCRLRRAVREDDHVSRFGGDEFVVVCDVKDQHSALDVAERIRHEVGLPYDGIPDRLRPTASIGLVLSDAANDGEVDQLLRAADQAMYRAKLSGGNKVVIGNNLAHRF